MKKFLLLLAMLAMPAISSSIMAASAAQKKFEYSIDPGSWYDIDGDGKMEWIFPASNYYHKLYRFTEDNTGQTLIKEDFLPVSTKVRYYWNKFGREDKIDLLAYRIENTTGSRVYEVEDNVASVLFSVDASLSRLDYNNDGHTDLWIKNSKISQRDQEVVTFGPSGEIRNEFIHIMSPAEYYDYWIAHPSLGIGPGISIVSPNYNDPPGSFGDYSQIDLNNDGYLDFIDMESGTYLLNLGNGYFVSDSMGGSVLFRDFDGDGLNDQFLYSKTDKSISVFLQREGEAEKVELFKGLACGNDIWCRDFDKDGDIDILVPFNAPDNKGSSYLLMFENNGNGSFRKHEYYVEGANAFFGCADVDADGNYEVIALEDSSTAVSIYNLKGIEVNTTGKYICECEYISSGSKCLIGDPANRGNLSLLIGNSNPRVKDSFQSKMDFYHFEGVNTPPARPVAPEVDYDPLAGTVKVSWELGSDKETAPLDLTYELRIGTAPDKGDILWADALPDGTRRRLGSGNTSYGRVRCFDAKYWPEGKIYVSLQVVDDNGKGSPFSEYAVFEKKMPPVGFTVSGPEITAVNDTVTLSLLAPSSASYTWDCDGGTVISQTDTSVSLVWKTPGIKKVRLHAVAMSGSKSELMREVEVFPARIKQVIEDDILAAFDMDGDGSMELLSNRWLSFSSSLNQFLEGDTDGVYTPVKRLFNSNLPTIVSARIADIDRDGRPDVISKTHQLINRGDKDMDVNEVKNGYYLSCDLDNDGCMDVSYLLRNSGNYIDFIETGNSEIYGGIKYYDYDNDGLTDIIRAYNRNFEIYKNYGGFKFSLLENIDLDDQIYKDSYSIGDVDGNGYADIVWKSSEKAPAVHVRWNDGQSADIDAPEGYRINGVGLFDFDNNGTHDLLLSLDKGSDNPYLAYAIAFFNPDRTWNMVKYMNNEQDPLTYMYTSMSMIYHRTDGRLGIFRNAIFGPENTPPTPPQNLRVERNEDYIVVKWDPASDAENPSAALKYNISIKYKDKEGEGAYFISPLNYGRNGVHVPAESTLINGTKFTIPLDVMPVGKFEIKVQAVDTQWQESDFSETLEYEFECIPFLSIPDATMVGKETEICLRTGFSVEDVDFGPDAEVLSSTQNLILVRWTTEGYKTVSCNGYEVRVLVHPAFDASFSIPEILYDYDRVLIECDNTHNSSWSYNHFEGTTFWPMEEGTLFEIDDNHVEVLAISTALPMWIKHTLTEDYGTAEYICVTHIKEHPVPIRPSDIFRDYESGNNVVCWTVPEHLVDKAIGVNVYKEEYDGEKYEEKKIASLPIDIAHFIDMGTNPLYREYYGISYVYPYGESQKSDMETPMLLSVYLNEDGDWMLTWSHAYEDIECYQILRGTSPDDLYPLDWVDYAQQRYTDNHTFGQQYYYQVMALKERNNLESVFRRSNIVLSPEHPAGEESILSGNDGITVAYDRGESKCQISGMPEGNGKQTVVEIYNLNGADLFHATFETSTATIDLSHLPDGIYILRAITGSSVVTERFIKHGQ